MPVSKAQAEKTNIKVTAEEIQDCYGKHRISREHGDSCHRRKNCPWGEACLSLANEEMDAKHYHDYAFVSVGNMFFDDGENKIRLNRKSNKTEAEIQDALSVVAQMSDETANSANSNTAVVLGDFSIPGAAYPEMCLAAEVLANMYFNTPTSFDCLMRKIHKGQNQADVARIMGITRQGLNKRLHSELGILQKRKSAQTKSKLELETAKENLAIAETQAKKQAAILLHMSSAELAVYRYCLDTPNVSATMIARATGLSRKTIYQSIHNLRTKYGIEVTLSAYKKTKKQKFFYHKNICK